MLSALLLAGCRKEPVMDAWFFYIRFSDYTEFSNYMGSAPLNKEKAYVSIPSDLDKFDLLDFQIRFWGSGGRYPKKPYFASPECIHIQYKVDVTHVESVTLEINKIEKKDITGAIQFKKTKEKIKDYPTIGIGDRFHDIIYPDYTIFSNPRETTDHSPTDLKVFIDATTETLEEETQIKDQLFTDIKDSLVTYRV
jgi:hypothetical protein